jgi:plasmid stabilization system protein ParE
VRRLLVTGPARKDIGAILRYSGENFGDRTAANYARLIDRALKDLAEEIDRHGVRAVDDIRKGYFLYHLKWSRGAHGDGTVRRPRHLIAFYVDASDTVVVARLFHERQMPSRHLTASGGG